MPADRWWRSTVIASRLAWPRLVERPLWRWRYRNGFPPLAPTKLGQQLGVDGSVVEHLAARHGERFGIATGDRSAFAAAGVDRAEELRLVVEAANQVLERQFDVLGSGPIRLPTPIDWHQDWKSGIRWEPKLFWRINYTNLEAPSDVKVPWEVARFHWASWLARAWWGTGDPKYVRGFGRLTREWMDANPLGCGIHWANPMELSIRAANWILAFGYFHTATDLDQAFWLRYLEVLLWHGRVIRGNLEVGRRSNNHYVADGLGLFLLGLFFQDGTEGKRWLKRGKHILEQQVRWQVHPDGVDYEKSISYHRLVSEFFVVAAALSHRNGVEVSAPYRARLDRMFDFMSSYTRADGTSPLVSDADDGRLFRLDPSRSPTDHRDTLGLAAVVLGRADLKAVSGDCPPDVPWLLGLDGLRGWRALGDVQPATPSTGYAQGGYYIFRGPDTHMFLDAGTIGFDGNAGHGHNDTLSFELAGPGGVFICDSGTYCYTSDSAGHRAFASTAAHNTVTVDDAEIAEITSIWRVREDRTDPRVLEWDVGGAEERFAAEHFGYARLPGRVVHRRSVRHYVFERRWHIVDTIRGEGRHSCTMRLHLPPDVELLIVDPCLVLVRRPGGTLRIRCSEPLEVREGLVAPRYGVQLRAKVLSATRTGDLPCTFSTELSWETRQ